MAWRPTRSRKAIESWDDQFGYELINADMELAFPPSVPGTKEMLEQVVESSKQRQKALLAANPKLAREYAMAMDSWQDLDQEPSDMSLGAGEGAGGGNSSLNLRPIEDAQNWSMVQPLANGSPPPSTSSSTAPPPSAMGSAHLPNGAVGATSSGALAAMQSGSIPSSSFEQSVAPNGQSDSNAANQSGTAEGSEGGQASNAPPSTSSLAVTNQSAGSSSSQQNTSSMGGGGAPTTGSMTQPVDAVNPEQGQTPPAVPSASIQLGESNQKYVKPEGDLKPISVGAGKNWAQAKAEGKATPVSRTIQIVAINSKWLIRSEQNPNQFERIILLANGPKQVSDELAEAIRDRVDSWGLSLPGGYWVPMVVVESASDAQTSVGRLERLLEGSGVDLRVVPLTIPK